jgi:mannose-6-phosphate isomerase-like protein (cupin superfamily)
MSDYTITNLDGVEDRAASSGLDWGEVRFPRTDVNAHETGFAHIKIGPNNRQSFGHRHSEAEEVYFVLGGSGAVKLDEEIRELQEHDLVRVAPPVMRSFEGGPDGLELFVFGTHHENDGEISTEFWPR